MSKTQPYSEYREVSLPWLSKIPLNWDIKRAKFVFNPIDIRSETGNEEILSVSANDGVVPRSQKNVTMFMAESYVGHKLCWEDDLVINSLWAWAKGLGFSKQHGLVSSAYGVYRLKQPDKAYAKYLHYALRSLVYDWEFRIRSKGIWTSRLQLTDDAFFDMPILLPPLEEQQKIVSFIQQQDRRIRKFIRNKRRTLELIENLRVAAITRLITPWGSASGLFSNGAASAPANMPREWSILPLQAVFRERKLPNTGMINKNVLSLSYGKLVKKDFSLAKGLVPETYETWQIIQSGDTVLRLTDLQNDQRSLRVGYCESDGIVSSAYLALMPVELSSSRYMSLVLSVYDFNKLFYGLGGGCRQSIGFADIKRLPIFVPPSQEQQRILLRIEKLDTDFASRRDHLNKEIALVEEYRSRLISDAVTGKIDLRSFDVTRTGNNEDIDTSHTGDESIESGETVIEGEVSTGEAIYAD